MNLHFFVVIFFSVEELYVPSAPPESGNLSYFYKMLKKVLVDFMGNSVVDAVVLIAIGLSLNLDGLLIYLTAELFNLNGPSG